MQSFITRASSLALLVVGMSVLGGRALGQQTAPPDGFFHYGTETSYPTSLNVTALPFLENNAASAAQVAATLTAGASQGKPLAIAVREPLTNPAALAIFDQFAIKYVMADYEDAARVGRTRSLADQVLNSTLSKGAFVGNFNSYPNAGVDPTRPSSLAGSQANSFKFKVGNTDYATQRGNFNGQVGNQHADPALYPGAPDYRNPAQGNSNAPNIRAALFTLPIQRLTLAELGLKGFSSVPGGSAGYAIAGPNTGSQRLIPYVTRFNNWGNAALGGGPTGTGFVQNAATPSNGQLLSRGDFQAQVLHYRMRGADSANLFNESEGSVVGYSKSQEANDLRTGWAASNTANQIFGRGNYAFANLTNVIGDTNSNSGDVGTRSTEVSGAVWSGVYDRAGSVDPASGKRKLMILLSNMGATQKVVDLPNNIGGFSTFKPPGSTSLDRFDDFEINPGQHRLLNFSLMTSSRGRLEWVFQGDSFIGLDNNRNGVGIPEPASMGLLGLASLGLLARRRRKAVAA